MSVSTGSMMESSIKQIIDRAAPPCAHDIPSDVANRRLFAWVSTTLVLVLAILSYVLRIWARKKSFQPLKLDDYLMGIGLLITLEPAICEYMLMANGLGHHICHVPAEQKYHFARLTFALQRANQPALVCIKSSILLFYMRLFPSNKFKMFAYANLAYTIGWGIATWFVNLTVCTPIAFYYDRTIPGGHCKNQVVSGTVNGALSLVGDIFILALPIPMIFQLQINLRRKVALAGIFLLGSFVCVTSAIRIAALIEFTPNDATYTQVYASGWTFMEMGVAVISGNLPLMRPLFERFFRMRGVNSSKNGGSNPTSSHLQSSNNLTGKSRFASKVDADGFERISDDGSNGPNSLRDIEMGDRTILVKTDFTVKEEQAQPFPEESIGNRAKHFSNPIKK